MLSSRLMGLGACSSCSPIEVAGLPRDTGSCWAATMEGRESDEKKTGVECKCSWSDRAGGAWIWWCGGVSLRVIRRSSFRGKLTFGELHLVVNDRGRHPVVSYIEVVCILLTALMYIRDMTHVYFHLVVNDRGRHPVKR